MIQTNPVIDAHDTQKWFTDGIEHHNPNTKD